jgi:pyruvate kinase
MMARICVRAEEDLAPAPSARRLETGCRRQAERSVPVAVPDEAGGSVRAGIAHAACDLALNINAAVIVCVTDSGATAAIFSHLRPRQPVLACTSDNRVARRLSLHWGVLPLIVGEHESVEDLLQAAVRLGLARKLLLPGDRAVFTGNLSGRGGETNLLAAVVAGSGQPPSLRADNS